MPGSNEAWSMTETYRTNPCPHQIYNNPAQKIDKQEIK